MLSGAVQEVELGERLRNKEWTDLYNDNNKVFLGNNVELQPYGFYILA